MNPTVEDAIVIDELPHDQETVADQEKAFSEGYKKAYEDLTQNKGFSPRKARRFLDSVARKNIKKFMKGKK
jgi:hypothetical protein